MERSRILVTDCAAHTPRQASVSLILGVRQKKTISLKMSAKVYLLQHLHIHEDGEESALIIGIFSTRERAESAVERLSGQPGFRDHPGIMSDEGEGFYISERSLDDISWEEGFITMRPDGTEEIRNEELA